MDSAIKDTAQDELRQVVARLLRPDFFALRADLDTIQSQLQQLENRSAPVPAELDALHSAILELERRTAQLEQHFYQLQMDLADPDKLAELVSLGLKPALLQGIQEEPGTYSEAISPIIAPAMRRQIREARSDMIEALYPIIGQTISKAVFEAIQDLRRQIDARLQQSTHLRQRFSEWLLKLRGVSEADIILRQSLSYTTPHIFLIHRQTGLLLQQVSLGEEAPDLDLVSAMLTAIRDFARDAFGAQDRDLEEIQFGESRILLKTGEHAYLAVVVEGVEPLGYRDRLQNSIHELNLKFEAGLSRFNGDMAALPDFAPALRPLLSLGGPGLEAGKEPQPFSRNQKQLLWAGAAGLGMLFTLAAFFCVFSVRLLPVAFPGLRGTPTPTPTTTEMPPTYTRTPTPVPTQTLTATAMPTASPAFTLTPLPSQTPAPLQALGVMVGNVWVRKEPSFTSDRFAEPVTTNTRVKLLAAYGDWVKISWETEFGFNEGWVPLEWVGLTGPIPELLVTPVQ